MATFTQIDLASPYQSAYCRDCGKVVTGLAAMLTHHLECKDTGVHDAEDRPGETECHTILSSEATDDAADLRW